MILELQCSAILCHGAHHFLGNPVRNFGLNLQRHLYIRADQAGEMSDDLVCYATGVTTNAGSIQDNATVKSLGLRPSLRWRR